MASYDQHCIKAILNLLIGKGIITKEEYREELTRIRYEESQAMKQEKYRISYEEYKEMLELKRKK